MIKTQLIELLHDDERSRFSFFISRDPQTAQTYQILLIDAWIGASDYMPGCPFLVCPSSPKKTGILFKDTYFLEPIDVVEPEALIVDHTLLNAVFPSVEVLTCSQDMLSALTEIDVLANLCTKERMRIVGIKKVENFT